MSDDFEQQEYFAIAKLVADFDQRLITMKSWGVTFSLAALGFGFQYRAFGFFLLAAASSIAFWAIEGTTKRHQMRHYPRMREIEVNRQIIAGEPSNVISAPRIDWSWQCAPKILNGKASATLTSVEPTSPTRAYNLAWMFPHVFLPHAVTFGIGIVLFLMGLHGNLPQFSWGATGK